MAFAVEVTPQAREHLRALRKRDQQIIVDAIEVQLTHQPDQETRNRKRLEENPLAPWELRGRSFRVFYEIDPNESRVVILAIGQKDHNTLRIGGEEIDL